MSETRHYGPGSDAGVRHWAIANTLIQTCKLNNVEPLAYLTDVLQRIVSGRIPKATNCARCCRGTAPGQRLYSCHRVVAAKSCDAPMFVAPGDQRLGSLDARNPANDTEKTTKLTNRC
jgi:IS66 C-terminal element